MGACRRHIAHDGCHKGAPLCDWLLQCVSYARNIQEQLVRHAQPKTCNSHMAQNQSTLLAWPMNGTELLSRLIAISRHGSHNNWHSLLVSPTPEIPGHLKQHANLLQLVVLASMAAIGKGQLKAAALQLSCSIRNGARQSRANNARCTKLSAHLLPTAGTSSCCTPVAQEDSSKVQRYSALHSPPR